MEHPSCSVCYEEFTCDAPNPHAQPPEADRRPRSLVCGHTNCAHCVERRIRDHQGEPGECVCFSCNVPRRVCDGFNFAVLDILPQLRERQAVEEQMEADLQRARQEGERMAADMQEQLRQCREQAEREAAARVEQHQRAMTLQLEETQAREAARLEAEHRLHEQTAEQLRAAQRLAEQRAAEAQAEIAAQAAAFARQQALSIEQAERALRESHEAQLRQAAENEAKLAQQLEDVQRRMAAEEDARMRATLEASKKPRSLLDRVLAHPEHRANFKRCVPPDMVTDHLLFQSTRDGFGAKAWQARCMERGATLTLVEVAGSGHIFAALTAVSFPRPSPDARPTVAADPYGLSCIVSLHNARGRALKFRVVHEHAAAVIHTRTGCGPAWGAGPLGCSLQLMAEGVDANVPGSCVDGGACSPDDAFELDGECELATGLPPPSLPCGVGFFAGQERFACAQIEVYSVANMQVQASQRDH